MKKKKRGSSFIIVIIIMAILFTTGSAILALAGSDYKMRVNSSRKLENMYAADSGLDLVYNVILKNSEAAIMYANQKISEEYNGQEMTKELYAQINVDFKNEFIKFLGTKSLEAGKASTDAILSQGIRDLKYMEFKEKNNIVSSAFKNLFEDDIIFDWKYIDNDEKYEIEILEYTYDDAEKTIKIKVQSTFETVNKEIKNKKILETRYTVSTPDYKEPISSDSVVIDIYPVFDEKVITTDGNLTLDGNVYIKGDVWVQGNYKLGKNPAYAFDKYRGGISMKHGTLNMEGDLITNRTLHVDDLGEINIKGNAYALNAYVGSLTKGGICGKTKLSIDKGESIGGDLIVNNDLSLNASHSDISMNNFYGINETNETSIENIDKAMKSSSIIINDTTNTSILNVSDSAYIMGVAYIDTLGDKYQTGESVAVKGNYLAYTEILEGYEDKVTLKYYDPLHLIETIRNENGDESSDITEKARYFEKYYEKNGMKISPDNKAGNGGIYLNKVYSTGSYVNIDENGNGTVGYDNNSISDGVVTNKRSDFIRNVFSMGSTNGIDETDEEIYKQDKVIKSVENQINLKEIDTTKPINEINGKLKINKNSNKTIVIKGSGDDTFYDRSKYDVIDAGETLKAIIITNGDVLVTGKVEFTGNIISSENVVIEGTNVSKAEDKKLIYDADVTRKIIAANYDILSEALKLGSSTGQQDTVNVGDNINIGIDADGYNLKGLVKGSNWKITK